MLPHTAKMFRSINSSVIGETDGIALTFLAPPEQEEYAVVFLTTAQAQVLRTQLDAALRAKPTATHSR